MTSVSTPYPGFEYQEFHRRRQQQSSVFLTMHWFWDSYVSEPARLEFTVSPLRASLEQLRGLPPALFLTCEQDIVRDEGEAYAHQLMAAGVPVSASRYLGAIHDLVLLNPIAETPPARAALAQVIDSLRMVFAHRTL